MFRGSPIKRAKLEGMQRNVAAVLGHRGSHRDREALMTVVNSQYPAVRIEAARALGRLGGESSRDCLEARMLIESELQVLDEIERALSLC